MSTNKKVKVGLIGLGAMGGDGYVEFLQRLQTDGAVEVVGVCDLIEEKADKAAATLHSKAYYDYIELFDKSGLEAVMIVVPHYAHTPISIEAFNRGLVPA